MFQQPQSLVGGCRVKMYFICNWNKVLYKELIKPHKDFLLDQGPPLVLIELNGNFATDFKGSWKEPWGLDFHYYMCASAHQICIWKDCVLVGFFVTVDLGFCYFRAFISTRLATCGLSTYVSKWLISVVQNYPYTTRTYNICKEKKMPSTTASECRYSPGRLKSLLSA